MRAQAAHHNLKSAAQIVHNATDRVIAVLDRMDGDAGYEDGEDAEPTLADSKNAIGSQVTWLRGNDQDRES